MGFILIAMVNRAGVPWSVFRLLLVSVLATLGFALINVNPILTLASLTFASGGLSAAVFGQTGMAVALYTFALRATVIGWTSAIGRAASILGPALGGLLLALAVPASEIILLTLVPIGMGCALIAVLARRAERTAEVGVESATATAL